MSYNGRPVSQGGNRGIDDVFSRNAPEGKFRVVSVDTFDGSDRVEGDFDSLEEARHYAFEKTGEEMLRMYVYDEQGECRYNT